MGEAARRSAEYRADPRCGDDPNYLGRMSCVWGGTVNDGEPLVRQLSSSLAFGHNAPAADEALQQRRERGELKWRAPADFGVKNPEPIAIGGNGVGHHH